MTTTKLPPATGWFAAAGFIATILAANYVTTRYGMVPVGFGLTATAGTYFAGLAFILRDTIQDTLGRHAVVALILTGAAVSMLLAATVFAADAAHLPPGTTPMSIAVASGVAFLVSEMADFAVYTPLRDRSYFLAVGVSNTVGAIIDTLLFLTIAGFPMQQEIAGQVIGKLMMTLPIVALGLVIWIRRRRLVTA